MQVDYNAAASATVAVARFVRAVRNASARWLLGALAAAALLAPGGTSQVLFGGVPLGPWGLLGLALVVYATLALPWPGWRVARGVGAGFGAALAIKLVLAATAPPLGIDASYWASGAPGSAAAERFSGGPPVDQRLDLQGEDFAVGFFNDATRFNFGPEVFPGRDQLPFRVEWRGFVWVPAEGERRLVLEAAGPARVDIDDAQVLSTPAGEGLQTAEARAALAAGVHAVRVDYRRPEAVVPRLRLAWQATPGGPLETLGAPALRRQAVAGDAGLARVGGVAADTALAAALVAWLLLGLATAAVEHAGHAGHAEHAERKTRRRRLIGAGLGAIPLVFLGYGMLLHAPIVGRTTILSGLDDWLIYESSARDILLNGPLMAGGQAHAPPYYGQPLYPYVLALAHWLLGDGLFGPLALQFAALGLVASGTFALARRACGSALAGLMALAGFLVLLALEPEHIKIARQLFNENLYMPLVLASLIALVGLVRRRRAPSWWQALLVGGLLGLTAIARSQFLLFAVCAVVIVGIAGSHAGSPSAPRGADGIPTDPKVAMGTLAWRRAAVRPVVLLVIGMGLVIAPITARNWLVSGQLVLISSSGGASLLEFHRPPPGLVDAAALDQDPVSQALHLDTQTRTVLAFIQKDPLGYLRTLQPLAAHSVGLQGRNDPGVYWPLLATCLLYVVGFGFGRLRRVHVWPIHAFVASHLLVLALFEADTYGYRLVMPMYAPMMAVAAQVPLELVRRVVRGRAGLAWGSVGPVAAVLAAAAFAQQVHSLADTWAERDAAFHGLGGAAAQAARAADAAGAGAIYVASVDGTPRRFGAGTLPGLRYPWFKWFDPARSLPLPPESVTAVYMLSELAGRDLGGEPVACLGAADTNRPIVLSGAQVRQRCVAEWPAGSQVAVTFDGEARFDAARVPATATAGDPLTVQLLWQPLVAHPAEPRQVSLHLEDRQPSSSGSLWGNATLDLYPVREWQPDEALLSNLALATDPTAIPDRYRLTLGISAARPNAEPAMATWNGSRTDRVPLAMVDLEAASAPTQLVMPAGMQALDGPPLSGGGLDLVGFRPPPAEAAPGGRLPLGLLWRAGQAAPTAAQIALELVRPGGEVVQKTTLPLFEGRLAPGALKPGSVVRDEEALVISGRVSGGEARLQVALLDAAGAAVAEPRQLATLTITGRDHNVDAAAAGQTPEAVFGEQLSLLKDDVDPKQLGGGGGKVTVHLRWRGLADMSRGYKVFVHVLDPAGQRVVAQRDAEPQDGKAPTTSWLVGEVVDDAYEISLPPGLAPGGYPIEVGVYDPGSGARLDLAGGDSRFLLSTRLEVR